MSKHVQLVERISALFPAQLAREIEALSRGRRISEIRIRRTGRSSVVAFGSSLGLSFSAEKYIDDIFMSVCRGTPYAYRDSILKGFVPLPNGVRVGVAGRARYEGEKLVGITDISSLIFRIPAEKCDFSDEIFEIWRRSRGGLLVFSAPGGGKTTALRSLARSISTGTEARRVALVDEREEIFSDELSHGEIDVLSGYRRAYGISLATRTLNPEVIITDEIAPEDAEAILKCANSGVPIIASAHAGDIRELMRRADIERLVERGVFGSFAYVTRGEGRFICKEAFVEK